MRDETILFFMAAAIVCLLLAVFYQRFAFHRGIQEKLRQICEKLEEITEKSRKRRIF